MRRIALLSLLLFLLASCAGRKELLRPDRAEQIVTHEARYGETWESIATDFYGDDERAEALARYNGADPLAPPEPGVGVRIPLSRGDVRSLRSRLDAVEIYNEGLDLATQGDYAGAVERFRDALERDSGFADASFNLAVTYRKLGLHDKAATVLEDLVMRNPGNPEYLFALGHARFSSGGLAAAEKSFGEALSVDPGHLKSLFALATVLEREGKIEKARDRFVEYLIRDPEGEWAAEARSRVERLNRALEEER
jgi:tetratricopeptide (TPR) repeat protein